MLLNLRDVSQEKWQETCKNVLMKGSIISILFLSLGYHMGGIIMYVGLCLSFIGVENFLRSFSKQDYFVVLVTSIFLRKKWPIFSCALCIDCNS